MFFRYLIRNILARKTAVIPAALAIMAAIGVTTTVLGLIEGLQQALFHSGPELNALITRKGVDDEYHSTVPWTTIGQLKAQPGIAKDTNGSPLVSPETISLYRFRSTKGFAMVTLRGVDPVAFQLHPGVSVEGTFPSPGAQGLVVGRRRLGELPGFQPGSKVRIGKSEWTVTGILDAPGSIFESEVWTDRSALQAEFQRPDAVSVAYFRVSDAAALGPLRTAMERDQSASVTARSEREFKASAYGSSVHSFIQAGLVITLLLGLAAVFTATNTLFTLYLGKITELGTLIAVGFNRRRILSLLLQEALIIALVSGGLGIGAALLVNGTPMSFEGIQLIFSVALTPRVLAAGAAATILLGVAASIAIVFNASRLNVLDALRSG